MLDVDAYHFCQNFISGLTYPGLSLIRIKLIRCRCIRPLEFFATSFFYVLDLFTKIFYLMEILHEKNVSIANIDLREVKDFGK